MTTRRKLALIVFSAAGALAATASSSPAQAPAHGGGYLRPAPYAVVDEDVFDRRLWRPVPQQARRTYFGDLRPTSHPNSNVAPAFRAGGGGGGGGGMMGGGGGGGRGFSGHAPFPGFLPAPGSNFHFR